MRARARHCKLSRKIGASKGEGADRLIVSYLTDKGRVIVGYVDDTRQCMTKAFMLDARQWASLIEQALGKDI